MLSNILQANASMNNGSNSTMNGTDDGIYNRVSAAAIFLSLYAIIFVLAAGGNCLVIWIVSTNRKMHDSTINYLLANLALADLIQTLSSIFHVVDFLVKNLDIGDVGCKFQINMYNIPYAASVLTLVCIAYERYCAVCKPIYLHGFKKRLKWLVPAIWLAGVCIYIPTIVYCGLRMDTEKNQLSCDCTERWPSLRAKNGYGIALVVFLYAIPLVVISRLYFVIVRRLRKAIPGENEGTVSTYQSRQGIVKMLLVTVIVFFVSWTPYNVLYFLKRIEYDYRAVYRYVWYPALLLAFISCAFNPFIYCFLSKNFRNAFKSILCFVKIPKILRGVSSSQTPASSSRESRRLPAARTLTNPLAEL